MTEYYLMNKECKLMLFTVKKDELSGKIICSEVERYVDEDRLPPKFISIGAWVDHRNYAKHKEHLVKWLKEWQIDDSKGFLEKIDHSSRSVSGKSLSFLLFDSIRI